MYQIDPPLSPKKTLPTMYDLPSENPEEPGLPDEFHDLQAEVLRLTFFLANYPADQVFIGSDLNLYYDVHNTNWYKRPDWFAVLGVNRLYEKQDMRMSYVIWQEGISPFVIVELLSQGTEKEDLGETLRDVDKPPTKWEVYEQILRVPYYVVFDRFKDNLRIFQLKAGRYEEIKLTEPRLWMSEIGLGLGVWYGTYQGIKRNWLRWYDSVGNWILLPEEKAEQEKQRAEQEKQRAEQEKQRAEQEKQRAEQEKQRAEQEKQRAEFLAAKLRELGVELDE